MDLNSVLSFLSDEFELGKSYSTLNVYRSMLSSTLGLLGGANIGQHPLVVALMAGIFNSRPPKPRYERTWDVDSVLRHLRRCENSRLSLLQLSCKMVTLLALTTLLRVSELASINLSLVRLSPLSVSFSLLAVRKAQRSGPLQSFSIRRFESSELDPVECVDVYMKRTEPLRPKEGPRLLIGCVRPHESAGSSTVARWIKTQLGEAGVDTSYFSAHSTRGAASSKAAASGVAIGTVLAAASWADESTFARFYRRTPPPGGSVAEAVLQQ